MSRLAGHPDGLTRLIEITSGKRQISVVRQFCKAKRFGTMHSRHLPTSMNLFVLAVCVPANMAAGFIPGTG